MADRLSGHWAPSGRRRTLPALLAAVTLTGLVAADAVPLRSRVETELTDRATRALAAAGISGVSVRARGRDLVLTGQVPDGATRERALAAVRSVAGVRAAGSSRLDVTGQPGTGPTPAPTGGTPSPGGGPSVAEPSPAATGEEFPEPTATEPPASGSPGATGGPGSTDLPTTAATPGEPSPGSGQGPTDAPGSPGTGTGSPSATAGSPTPEPGTSPAPDGGVRPGSPIRVSPEVADLQRRLDALPEIVFCSGEAELTDDGLRTVRRAAALLRARPGLRVQVEGHTDDTGPADENQLLSEQRAAAVRSALVEAGVTVAQLSRVGYGEFYPLTGNDTPDQRARNRRVTLVALPPAG